MLLKDAPSYKKMLRTVAAVEAEVVSSTGGQYETWAQLQANPGTTNGDLAIVYNDPDTHYDPGQDSANGDWPDGIVPNEGLYTWSAGNSSWDYYRETMAADLYRLQVEIEASAASVADAASDFAALESSLYRTDPYKFGRADANFSTGGTIYGDRYFWLDPLPYEGTVDSITAAETSTAGTAEAALYRDVDGTLTLQATSNITLGGANATVTRALDTPFDVLPGDILAIRVDTTGSVSLKDWQSNTWSAAGIWNAFGGAFSATVALGAKGTGEPSINWNMSVPVQSVTAAEFEALKNRVSVLEVSVAALQAAELAQLPLSARILKRNAYSPTPQEFWGADPIASFTYVAGNEHAYTLTGPGVNVYSPDDPMVRKLGGTWQQAGGYPYGLVWMSSSTDYGNPTPLGQIEKEGTSPKFEILMTGDVFEFFTAPGPQNSMWVEVDGKFNSALAVPGRDGTFYHYKIDFGSVATRRIVVHLPLEGGFADIRVNGTLADPTPALSLSAYFMGDSITEGTGVVGQDLYISKVAKYLGIDDYANGGVGGTGYIQELGDKPNFQNRTDDVLTYNDNGPADILIVAGGINDNAFTDQQVEDAAYSFFSAIRAAAPETIIVACGPLMASQATYDGYLPRQQAIHNAANRVSKTITIDMSPIPNDDPLWPTYFDPGDPTHTQELGHQRIADVLGPAIAKGLLELL